MYSPFLYYLVFQQFSLYWLPGVGGCWAGGLGPVLALVMVQMVHDDDDDDDKDDVDVEEVELPASDDIGI